MKMFICEYRYETPAEKGHGKVAVVASDTEAAEAKAKMVAGVDSRLTDCKISECAGGFIRMGQTVDAGEIEIKAERTARHERAVAPRFLFEVASMAEVVASDRWEAYRKLAAMTKQATPPPGLKRKVVSSEPVDGLSRFDKNAQYKATRLFQGGKAGA